MNTQLQSRKICFSSELFILCTELVFFSRNQCQSLGQKQWLKIKVILLAFQWRSWTCCFRVSNKEQARIKKKPQKCGRNMVKAHSGEHEADRLTSEKEEMPRNNRYDKQGHGDSDRMCLWSENGWYPAWKMLVPRAWKMLPPLHSWHLPEEMVKRQQMF